MEKKNKIRIMAEVLQIMNGLIWAALMLISGYYLKGTAHFETYFNRIIIVAAIEMALFGYVSGKYLWGKQCNKEIA